MQLDLFEYDENFKLMQLERRLEEVEESTDRVRKGMFARHNDLAKKYLELYERMEKLEWADNTIKKKTQLTGKQSELTSDICEKVKD